MTAADRRDFLKRLARSAAYAAPVITSLAAPLDLVGQGQASVHKQTGGGDPGHGAPGMAAGQQAPWDQPPPGQP